MLYFIFVGAFGTVYRGTITDEDIGSDIDVAVKTIKAGTIILNNNY